MRRSSVRRIVLALVGTLAAGACGPDDGVDPDAPRFRVVDAIGDASALHVIVDNRVISPPQGLVLGEVMPYRVTSPAAHSVAVRAAGSTRLATVATFTMAPGVDYTIVAAGRSSAAGRAPQFIMIADTLTAPATGASVRLVHATASEGAVDVYFVAAAELISGTSPVLTGVPFGDVTAAITTSANRRVVVTRAGTKTVLIDVLNAINAPGEWLLVFMDDVSGTSNSPPFLLRMLNESAS